MLTTSSAILEGRIEVWDRKQSFCQNWAALGWVLFCINTSPGPHKTPLCNVHCSKLYLVFTGSCRKRQHNKIWGKPDSTGCTKKGFCDLSTNPGCQQSPILIVLGCKRTHIC